MFILCAAFIPPAWAAEEILVSGDKRTALAVTVYNGDLALVRDSRMISFPSGASNLAFTDISTRLQPETAVLRSGSGDFHVIEQIFDFDVVSRQSLLAASVGEKVTIVKVNPATGEENKIRAKVLSIENGVVLDIKGEITTDIPGRLVFDSFPDGLRTKPTLMVVVDAVATASDSADLSYLTGGLTWRADYVAELNADTTAIDLSAWATVTNTAGTDFPEATLKLIAGDINRAAPAPEMMRAMAMESRSQVMADDVREESLAAFHLYSIDRPVTLINQQIKQLSLLSVSRVAVHTDLVSRGDNFALRGSMNGQLRTAQAARSLVFYNTEEQGLGTPLPSGTVRVYGQDSSGALQLLGEDGLSHTPVGQEARVTLGRDFDVKVEREQTEFLRASDSITISAHKITVSNAKNEPVTVRVVEAMQGDWEVIEESAPHTKIQASAEWQVDVPAGSSAEVAYRARVRF